MEHKAFVSELISIWTSFLLPFSTFFITPLFVFTAFFFKLKLAAIVESSLVSLVLPRRYVSCSEGKEISSQFLCHLSEGRVLNYKSSNSPFRNSWYFSVLLVLITTDKNLVIHKVVWPSLRKHFRPSTKH